VALTETLRLVINADTRGAVQNIENVGKAADKSLAKSKGGLDKLGSGLTKAGTGMIAFGAVALAGLGGLAKMSEEANLATVKLDNTLSNMPKLAGENAKQFTDLATKIQSVTAADADAIVEGEAMLGTFNLTADQIKKITPLVVDYARKFGLDIPQAATMVGKALDGSVGALKRNGVSIDEVAFKTDHFGAVQKALSDQVGGFAQAEGATFAGSLERMKNQLGDLAEGVGGGAVDAFTTMFGAVGKAAEAMDKISPGAQNATGKIAAFGAAGLVAVGGLSTLIGQAILARQRFEALGTGIKAATSKLGGFGNAAKAGGIIAAIGALVLEARHLSEEANRIDVDKFAAALTSIGEGSKAAVEEAVRASIAFGNLERDVTNLAESNVPAAEQFIRVAQSMGVSEAQIRKLREAIARKKDEDVGAAKAQGDYTAEVDKAKGALDAETEATDAAKDALKEYQDTVRGLIDPLFGLQDALEDNIKAQGDVTAKQFEAIAAEKAYVKAVKEHGPKSKEAAAASLELMGAQQALTDAQRHAVRSAEDVDLAIAELRSEIQQNPKALDQAKNKLKEWQRQGLITAGQAKKTAAEFDRLAGRVRAVPGSKRILVSVRGSEDARVKIIRIRDALGQLHDKHLTIGVTTAIGPQAVGIMESKMFRASGGPVRADKAYIVGEKGPELFLPGVSGSVLPNSALGSPVSAAPFMGGGGQTVTLNINLAGADSQFMNWLRGRISAETGGDVQKALGRRR
jgi:hypothetical protein